MISIPIGEKYAYYNGEKITLATSSKLVKGCTMIPLRFISESLGASVDWDSYSRTVMINYYKGNSYVLEETTLFSQADFESDKLFNLPKGTNVTIIQEESDWQGNEFCYIECMNPNDNSITHGYVFKGTVYLSDDGKTWTCTKTNIDQTIYGISWDGNKYIAVGCFGVIYTSVDGVNWIKKFNEVSNWLRSITWGETKFVAVGDYGSIFSSQDGIEWESMQSGTTNHLSDIVWNGSQFVAVGYNGTILASSDGVEWETRMSDIGCVLKKVIWDGIQYLAVGVKEKEPVLLVSSNGIDWLARTLPSKSTLWGPSIEIKDIAYGNGKYIAVGNFLYDSTDSANWIRNPNMGGNGITWGNNQFVVISYDKHIDISPDGSNWSVGLPPSYSNGGFNDILWNGNEFIITDYCGQVWESKDAVNWSYSSLGGLYYLTGVAWNGNKYVIVGAHGIVVNGYNHFDFNKDGSVSLPDLALLGKNYGLKNSNFDLNGDGTVDIYDLVSLSRKLLMSNIKHSE